MPSYFCLLLPEATRKVINQIRTELFRKSGSKSFRTLPPCIMLGETEKNSLPAGLDCPNLPLKIGKTSCFMHDQLFFPIENKFLQPLKDQLGVSYPITGIFLGSIEETIEATLPPVDDLRLALLEIKETEGLTLWRILSEKHLQTDKG
ncbi:hypothetical protein [uncultured Sphaerochaeta sp.]|uniref:hypothetical protein n=1 Tax=uncultured Sphaerochaeta sp. TaxID=886478 RepID=UPI002A0A6B66|nr:hypothetical protein [uncultured Sphaerochaeta sp.]